MREKVQNPINIQYVFQLTLLISGSSLARICGAKKQSNISRKLEGWSPRAAFIYLYAYIVAH